jgi:hypothetical protein
VYRCLFSQVAAQYAHRCTAMHWSQLAYELAYGKCLLGSGLLSKLPRSGFSIVAPLVTVVALAFAGVRSDPGGISTAHRGAQPLRGGAAGNRNRHRNRVELRKHVNLSTRNDVERRDTTCGYAEGVDGINTRRAPDRQRRPSWSGVLEQLQRHHDRAAVAGHCELVPAHNVGVQDEVEEHRHDLRNILPGVNVKHPPVAL